jgi:exodeoxyribonuclease VII large subunit
VDVQVASVAVQGKDAVREICGAFRWFNAHPNDVDVLVLTRGGGSMEDLQAFNSEEVARAVFGSVIPVVVGVGHERDESLADYVADVRASTPSNAAERLVPDRREILARIEGGTRGMESVLRGEITAKRDATELLMHRIESHARRGIDAFSHLLRDFSEKFTDFQSRIRGMQAVNLALTERLSVGAKYWSAHLSHRLSEKEKLLKLLDPQRPLQKGYALVRGAGGIVTDASKVPAGSKLEIRLRKGTLGAEVVE